MKCWSVGIDYILEKLPVVSGSDLVEAGRYRMVSKPTLAVSRWDLIDEDVDLLRG